METALPASRPTAAPWWFQGALLVLIFLSFFQNGLTVLLNVKLRLLSFLILGGLVAFHFWRRATSRAQGAPVFEYLILAWVAYGSVSALTNFRFGLQGETAYVMVYNFIFEYAWALAYFGGKYAATRNVDFRRILAWTLVFGSVLTGFAVLEKFFHTYVEAFLLLNSGNEFVRENFEGIFRRGYGADESGYRCVSFVLEFIAFSYVCCFLALAFLVQWTETRRLRYALGMAVSLAALFLTQSLAALAAFVLIALFHLFVVKKLRSIYLVYLFATAGAFIGALMIGGEENALFGGIRSRILGVFSGQDEGLIVHFQESEHPVINNFALLGHGMGTADFLQFNLADKMSGTGYRFIEHEYFRVLFEFGGVGIILYAACFASLFLFIGMRARVESDPWRRGMFLLTAYWLVQNFLVGFAHRSFPIFESSVFPALLAGYLVGSIPVAGSVTPKTAGV